MIRKRSAFIGAVLLVLLTAFTTLVVSNIRALQVGDHVIISRQMYQQMQEDTGGLYKLTSLKEFLLQEYYQELDEETLLDGAIRGMFESVDDPYTTYLDARDYSDLMMSTRGTYGGIGIIVTADEDGFVSVISPIEGTPGERAGLATGDRILRVDDESVSGNRLDDAVSLMRGEPNTEVVLELMKRNQRESIEVIIMRETIRIQSVRSEIMENDIGYLRISSFDEQTARDFQTHMDTLERSGVTQLILDLRNNPGGLLNQANRIADLLLGEGLIVYTEDRHGNRREEMSDKKMYEMELVVLINEGSASASEILAGAIQDHQRGVLVGTTSFGKGLVQELQQLPDGTGFKYTVSQYFTPNGRYIHDTGIEPDVVVEIPEELLDEMHEVTEENDLQLQKAIELLQGS
ncbi:S41 family peptidase [Anoxynatronum sibiricum]|uniref:S41 family peptidase n=1 Tax=Anoxynatronum sibiricum TaxID=210623 RepID=A0ABU9VPR0_9CLOT